MRRTLGGASVFLGTYPSVPSDRAEHQTAQLITTPTKVICLKHIIPLPINSWYFIVVTHWIDVQYLFNTDSVITDDTVPVQIQYSSVSSGCSLVWFGIDTTSA